MNLTCAIVDDEPLALDLLESYINKTPFLTLAGKYSSASTGYERVAKQAGRFAFPRHTNA